MGKFLFSLKHLIKDLASEFLRMHTHANILPALMIQSAWHLSFELCHKKPVFCIYRGQAIKAILLLEEMLAVLQQKK